MTPDDMLDRLSGRLSRPRRLAVVGVLLAGAAMTLLILLLWVTEPELPARTQLAFAGLVAVGLAWVGYAAWVLTSRLPLYALDRVVAAWLGLGATVAVAVPVALIAAAPLALTVVGALLALAVTNLVRSRRRRAALLRRKRALGG
ncbi:hypothetical protein [Dactylosporangium matsuzakiense]|uniref:Uncharacterized protein n=1 Tax=Dactylosporangium matsuzakiense TaxID=53360 RepID=A0A9W6KKJ8_9ACTN|nr:hypothetical protein [Dactylosporangium matsuzakiense]UWZ48167.1 hypothetical protein Dmats_18240 [Dactylosporangium matsuzakiense]GLL03188.1 hypothetical protein GCM10017581_049310 [Dactylosporangium matsuzakiense]